MRHHLYTFTALLLFATCAKAQFQGIIINEISENYVELLVTGKKTCTDSTVNLRGWIIDDNNGWFGVDVLGSNASVGHLRFSFYSSHWNTVPYGSIILLYNEKAPHPKLPVDDYLDLNKDYLYVLPATVHLDEDVTLPVEGSTAFTRYNSNYKAGAQTSWKYLSLDPKADAFMIVDPSATDQPHFAFAWGNLSNGIRATLGKAGGIFKPSLDLSVANCYLKNDRFDVSSNYVQSTEATPGYGNTPENQAWIDLMRIPANPVLNITNPGVCAPATIDLTDSRITSNSSIGLSLSYWMDAGATVPLKDEKSVPAGTYYIKAINALGCTTTKPVTAYIVDQPAPAVLQVDDRCDGTSVLSASGIAGGAQLEWSNGSSASSITVSQAGNYTVVQNLHGCKSEPSSVLANPKTAPIPWINAPAVLCGRTGTIEVSATNGAPPYLYSINGSTFTSTTQFQDLPAGTYTITVKDNSGCTAVSSVNLISNQFTVSIDAPAVECGYTGSITIQTSGGRAPFSFSIDGNPFVTQNQFNNLPPGNYHLVIRDQAGCELNAQATINSFKTLHAVANAAAIPCGQTGSVTVVSNGGTPPYTYSIDGNNFQQSNIFTNLAAGQYTVTVNDQLGCTTITSATLISLNSPVQLTAAGVVDKCTGFAEIKAKATGGTGSYLYSVNGVLFNSTGDFLNMPEGDYIVEVTDGLGCTAPPTSVTIKKPEIFSISLVAPQTAFDWGEQIRISVAGNKNFSIKSWEPAAVFTNQTGINQIFKADTSIVVKVVAISENGCPDSAGLKITVSALNDSYIPSAFTPNGDGKNDRLRVIAQNVKEFDLKIFNRWGQLVFQTNDIRQGWDGTFKGEKQQSDVFVYLYTLENKIGQKITRKGTVTLIR